MWRSLHKARIDVSGSFMNDNSIIISAYEFKVYFHHHVDGILPRRPYPTNLRMTDRAPLAGHPRCNVTQTTFITDVYMQTVFYLD